MDNWFVKQGEKKNIKEVRRHARYLMDENEESHYYSKIKELSNVVEKYNNIRKENESYIKEMKKNGGGRPPKTATTYILSIPEDVAHPTNEEWNKIYEETIERFCDLINKNQEKKERKGLDHVSEENRKAIERYNSIRLKKEVFLNNSFAVVHNEEEGFEKASHLHICTSNIQEGQYLKMLNQTAGYNFIKDSYSQAVKNVLGYDCLDYVPKSERLTEEEKKKLDMEDERQFQERIKEKEEKGEKVRKRRRRRKGKSKPQSVINDEKIKAAKEAEERLEKAKDLEKRIENQFLKTSEENLNLREENKIIEEENNKIKKQVKKSEEQKKKNLVVAKKAKIFVRNKEAEAEVLEELNKEEKKKIKEKKLENERVEEILKQNQSFLYNIIKSDVVVKYIKEMQRDFPIFHDFYKNIRSFFIDLESKNKKYMYEIERKEPGYFERIEEERRLKKENRHRGNEFVFEDDCMDDYEADYKNETELELENNLKNEIKDNKKEKKKSVSNMIWNVLKMK